MSQPRKFQKLSKNFLCGLLVLVCCLTLHPLRVEAKTVLPSAGDLGLELLNQADYSEVSDEELAALNEKFETGIYVIQRTQGTSLTEDELVKMQVGNLVNLANRLMSENVVSFGPQPQTDLSGQQHLVFTYRASQSIAKAQNEWSSYLDQPAKASISFGKGNHDLSIDIEDFTIMLENFRCIAYMITDYDSGEGAPPLEVDFDALHEAIFDYVGFEGDRETVVPQLNDLLAETDEFTAITSVDGLIAIVQSFPVHNGYRYIFINKVPNSQALEQE